MIDYEADTLVYKGMYVFMAWALPARHTFGFSTKNGEILERVSDFIISGISNGDFLSIEKYKISNIDECREISI